MAQVTAAVGAVHLGPRHEEAAIDVLLDGASSSRRVEARPAGGAFELGLRLEQRAAAAGAVERASRFSWLSGLVPARSVPCSRSTWNWLGESVFSHSSLVFSTANVFSFIMSVYLFDGWSERRVSSNWCWASGARIHASVPDRVVRDTIPGRHPAWLRCSPLKYSRSLRYSRAHDLSAGRGVTTENTGSN